MRRREFVGLIGGAATAGGEGAAGGEDVADCFLRTNMDVPGDR
jgi:hypothetical protein